MCAGIHVPQLFHPPGEGESVVLLAHSPTSSLTKECRALGLGKMTPTALPTLLALHQLYIQSDSG